MMGAVSFMGVGLLSRSATGPGCLRTAGPLFGYTSRVPSRRQYKTQGPRLREWREAARLTQADLATLLTVDPATVYRWEAGIALPRRGIRGRLARRLGISREDLEAGLAG
jgi:DNA-binding XRE family transcriptional regulator